MHQQTIKDIVEEIRPLLVGRFLGRVFQLPQFGFAFDFRLRDEGYLLVDVSPQNPRIHLIKRRVRELEKESVPLGPFGQALRANLGGAELVSLVAHPTERIVSLEFSKEDELGTVHQRTLLAQLTGRSANLFLLNANNLVTHALRPPRGEGQQIGEPYASPPQQTSKGTTESTLERGDFLSLSEAADDYFTQRERTQIFAARVHTVRERLRKELSQLKKLKDNLSKDLKSHGKAEEHKRLGELLLANISTAERLGPIVRIKDYYAEGEPVVELEIDEKRSLQEEAARYFSRYGKSKRAHEEIAARLARIEPDLELLDQKLKTLETAASSHDEAALSELEPKKRADRPKSSKSSTDKLPGVRRYRSSDGYEILVGRAAHTNDHLTFKVAKPHDVWLHTADYPGSHVVIRNQGRKEIPHRTIIEAAQLAAKFSQAGDDSKVNVNYTQRKFLSKPKGVAPGLVRMSSFHTVTVAPGESIERV